MTDSYFVRQIMTWDAEPGDAAVVGPGRLELGQLVEVRMHRATLMPSGG
jgi:hypothetical protein